ncbi:hypothetical protein [Ammoniphilus sp. 3BR4]|uniref:hypothetical protein n=1 Tax=Ammoniphilus sp. 3BR4 TaxID=3158265 RepID=UPI003467A116
MNQDTLEKVLQFIDKMPEEKAKQLLRDVLLAVDITDKLKAYKEANKILRDIVAKIIIE